MNDFSGIWIPLITPFRDGRIDIAAAQTLAQRLSRSGISGLVVCGTTGEAATLNDDEQTVLLHAILEAVQCPVIMGLSDNHTSRAAQRARRFDEFDIAGFLVAAPYYVRPSQEGIRRHFEEIISACGRPIILYHIPYRTGVHIELSTVRQLAANPRVVAIKESGGGDIERISDLVRDTELTVLSGEDSLIYVTACLGGHGAIAAAAHLLPESYVRMLECVRAGDLNRARTIWSTLLPLIRLLFSEPNPGPLKAALALQGWIREELRLPMTPITDRCRQRIATALSQLPA
jgi:4-hydroxy-tetrahydrodipicolinate synthase